MKILMISNNYYPYTGGVARSVAVTMKLLQQEGHEVQLITYNFTGQDSEELGVHRVYCPLRFKYRGKIIPISWGAHGFIKNHIDSFKPDIIHLHHPFLLGIWGLRTAYKNNIPIVFTHHTLYELYVHYLPFGQTLARYLLPTYLKIFYKYVNGCIAPSSAVREYIQTMTHHVCEVIPSSVDSCFRATNPKLENNMRHLQLMTASRLVPEKNIEQLLKACSLLKVPFTFTICGDGYHRAHLEKVSYKQYGFSKEQVQFMGEVDSPQLAKFYRAADVFIFASQTETQGLVVGEAMACGTPVIAFRGSGVEDALQNDGGVLVENVQEMANILEELFTHSDQLHTISKRAYQQSQQFHASFIGKKLSDFYKCVISKV